MLALLCKRADKYFFLPLLVTWCVRVQPLRTFSHELRLTWDMKTAAAFCLLLAEKKTTFLFYHNTGL